MYRGCSSLVLHGSCAQVAPGVHANGSEQETELYIDGRHASLLLRSEVAILLSTSLSEPQFTVRATAVNADSQESQSRVHRHQSIVWFSKAGLWVMGVNVSREGG